MKLVRAIIVVCLSLGCTVSVHAIQPIANQYSAPARYRGALLFSNRAGSELYAVDKKTKQDVWVWSSGGRAVRTMPTVVDGVAYIWAGATLDDCRACAVDCETGTSLWETPDKGWTFSSAIVAGDIVLFAVGTDKHNRIHAFNRKTGKPLWLREDYDMMLVHGQVVLATTDKDRRVALLDVESGKDLFEAALIDEDYREPHACCNAEGIAVVGCRGALLALSIPRQKVLWRVSSETAMWAVAIGEGKLYVASSEFGDRGDRVVLQLRSIEDGAVQQEADVQTRGYTYFPPQVFEKVLVVAACNEYGAPGVLVGYDRKGMRERWRLEVPHEVYQVAADEDSVHVGGGFVEPYLWQVDALTGKKIWTYGERPQTHNPSDE